MDDFIKTVWEKQSGRYKYSYWTSLGDNFIIYLENESITKCVKVAIKNFVERLKILSI